jgi:hypothetical protein
MAASILVMFNRGLAKRSEIESCRRTPCLIGWRGFFWNSISKKSEPANPVGPTHLPGTPHEIRGAEP